MTVVPRRIGANTSCRACYEVRVLGGRPAARCSARGSAARRALRPEGHVRLAATRPERLTGRQCGMTH